MDREECERSSQGKKVGDAVAGERSRRSRSSIRHVKSRPRWPRPLAMPEWMAAMATSIVWEFARPMRQVRGASSSFPSRWRLRFSIGHMSPMLARIRKNDPLLMQDALGPVAAKLTRARTEQDRLRFPSERSIRAARIQILRSAYSVLHSIAATWCPPLGRMWVCQLFPLSRTLNVSEEESEMPSWRASTPDRDTDVLQCGNEA